MMGTAKGRKCPGTNLGAAQPRVLYSCYVAAPCLSQMEDRTWLASRVCLEGPQWEHTRWQCRTATESPWANRRGMPAFLLACLLPTSWGQQGSPHECQAHLGTHVAFSQGKKAD